ncbi:MAG: NAD(P)H-dependent oxidoreductase [Firmicutes bacterium]|nr:NAD(P)H-dependent oxidoreductase [Bacillota bacterium]
MKNILVVNGHEYYDFAKGELNKTLFSQITNTLEKKYQVKTTVIQDGYDIKEEQGKFKWADVIILQTPIYWMNVPGLLKTYMDKVFEYDIFFTGSPKYGQGGLMKDKKYMLSTTWNAPEYAFNDKDTFFDGRNVDEVLIHLHKTMEFIGMTALKSFSAHDVIANPDIEKYTKELDSHLKEVFKA